MKYLLTLFLACIVSLSSAEAQHSISDQELLSQKIEKEFEQSPREKRGLLFGLYKNHISEQILNDCIYDHSCSLFSKDVFTHYGIVKGMFLTADRLTRCNRATFAEISPLLKSDTDRALDHWDYYAFKK